jgi:phage FluMu protein Com
MPSAPLDFREIDCPKCGATGDDTEFQILADIKGSDVESGHLILKCPGCKEVFKTEYQKRFYAPEPIDQRTEEYCQYVCPLGVDKVCKPGEE